MVSRYRDIIEDNGPSLSDTISIASSATPKLPIRSKSINKNQTPKNPRRNSDASSHNGKLN